jgi:hypothetical protein
VVWGVGVVVADAAEAVGAMQLEATRTAANRRPIASTEARRMDKQALAASAIRIVPKRLLSTSSRSISIARPPPDELLMVIIRGQCSGPMKSES